MARMVRRKWKRTKRCDGDSRRELRVRVCLLCLCCWVLQSLGECGLCVCVCFELGRPNLSSSQHTAHCHTQTRQSKKFRQNPETEKEPCTHPLTQTRTEQHASLSLSLSLSHRVLSPPFPRPHSPHCKSRPQVGSRRAVTSISLRFAYCLAQPVPRAFFRLNTQTPSTSSRPSARPSPRPCHMKPIDRQTHLHGIQ